ncbi:hypothetical protein [Streptomyces sp. NPDC005533]|uniref:hypothetical protein n=1 Tax=Streptomyces sp. NPDC005533 TaxID=3364723 RepID=UPI0036B281BC
MTHPRAGVDLPGDHGPLKWVVGVPLALVNLLDAFFVYTAVRYGPAAGWDDQGYAGTTAVCLLALGLSVTGFLLTLVPPVRRMLGPWWFVPPVVLGAVAWIRMVTLS